MKTRMLQHLIFLMCIGILWTGCQSTPFARRSQTADALVENDAEVEEESAIQKKLRVAMAEERKKARQSRMRERSNTEPVSEQLAELATPESQQIVQTSSSVESQALPLSTAQSQSQQTDNISVLRELNQAYDADRSGNLEKAQGYYQRVLSKQPDHFEALHRLAIIEDKKKNFPAAESYYLRALKLDPANADLLSDIGYSYMLQGRDDYGEKYLQEALKYQPGHVRSLDHLGWYYGRTGQYDQALKMFRMTSGEAQAQQKFARLFPGVNAGNNPGMNAENQNQITAYPGSGPSLENSNPGIQPVGQRQPESPQPVQYAANGYPENTNRERPVQELPQTASMNPTQQIAEMMRREREKAIQARNSANQLPAISPNPVITQTHQLTGTPEIHPPAQNRELQPVNPPAVSRAAAKPVTTEPVQIQAWPPANDPTLTQAVQASQYWSEKEQQQLQNQQRAQAPAGGYYQNQSYQQQNGQGFPQQQQSQARNLSPGYQQQSAPRQAPPPQRMPSRVPHVGQPLYGNQYQTPPGQFPNYRINATQQDVPQTEAMPQNNEQALMREVARTGMNMGPGQMFPVTETNPPAMNGGNSPLMSSQMGTGGIVPASAQVPVQNAYQPGGQNIIQPQLGQSMGGVRQAGYEYASQSAGQNQVQHVSMPQQFPVTGNAQPVSSALPQSALYSTNPAVAPANVRSQNSAGTSPGQQGGYQGGTNSLQNQNSAQPPASNFQWGNQPDSSPYRFTNQNTRY